MEARGGSSHDIRREDFGLRDVLGTSARIYGKHFGPIAMVGLAIYLPIEAFMAWIAPASTGGFQSQFEVMEVEGIFDLLFGIIAALIVIRLTANAMDGGSTALADVWRQARRRYFSSVATTVAMNMVLLGLAVILVLPAVAGLVYMLFYLQVPALREETGFHALKHSKAVIEGRFWRVAGYAVLFGLGDLGLSFLGDLAPWPALGVALSALGQVLDLYLVVAATVLYLHLDRTRFGYDE